MNNASLFLHHYINCDKEIKMFSEISKIGWFIQIFLLDL